MMHPNNSCRLWHSFAWLLILTGFCCTSLSNVAYAQDPFIEPSMRQVLVEQTKFIQIPGPNRIIRPGPEGAWDDLVLEAADAFEDLGTYYFYYHATNRRMDAYQIGVASAPGPLGPFKKHGEKPIIEVGHI